jgi:hypothetical protein
MQKFNLELLTEQKVSLWISAAWELTSGRQNASNEFSSGLGLVEA